MTSLTHRAMLAAVTLEELNARCDLGERAAWTVEDVRRAAGSFAAEDHVDGVCPACCQRVLANDVGCVCLHVDTLGKTCPASGLAFHVAVVL